MKFSLKKTEKIIKDLILFDNTWVKRKKLAKEINLSKLSLERLAVYRELVNNSFLDLLTRVYPYTKRLLANEWQTLLSNYIINYPPQSPVLNQVAKDFPLFLSKEKSIIRKYPFIGELALYEWLELEIAESKNLPLKKNEINPIHTILKTKYPIPEIIRNLDDGGNLKKTKPKKTNIIIYREPTTFRVRYFELSQASLGYIELKKQGFNDDDIFEGLMSLFQVNKKDIIKFIGLLKKNKIIIS